MSTPAMPRTVGYFDEYRDGYGATPATVQCSTPAQHTAHYVGGNWCPGAGAPTPRATTVKISVDHPAIIGVMQRELDRITADVVAHLTDRIAHHEAIASEFGPNSPASCCDEDDPSFVEYDPTVHAAAVACAEELRAVRRVVAGDERVVGRAEKSQAFFGG